MTTDLLSVWTDPDTAMHAVGSSLGIFADLDLDTGAPLPDDAPLRHALFDVLLTLVDDGELEQRACSDGRFAFRWRAEVEVAEVEPAAVSTGVRSSRLTACLESMPRQVAWSPAPAPQPQLQSEKTEKTAKTAYWPRLVAALAPLLLPALSCLSALAAYVTLGPTVGIAILVVLALAGVVGLVRRVPLAGFWTTGLVVAALLMRWS